MGLEYVLIASIAVQLAAAVVAISLVPLTDRRLAWMLIASALLLMTVRRIISLVIVSESVDAATMNSVQEYVGLVLSLFMLAGVACIRPIFLERSRIEEKLRRQATTDDLTGVSNRRHFFEMARGELKRVQRHTEPVAVVFMDIDLLKDVNDTLGHSDGDAALVSFAHICRTCIREIDVLARMGGDEFSLLLPATSREQARVTVERIRSSLKEESADRPGAAAPMTFSAGITGLSGEGDTIDALLRRADRALYAAKAAGRDNVVVDEREETPVPPGTPTSTT